MRHNLNGEKVECNVDSFEVNGESYMEWKFCTMRIWTQNGGFDTGIDSTWQLYKSGQLITAVCTTDLSTGTIPDTLASGAIHFRFNSDVPDSMKPSASRAGGKFGAGWWLAYDSVTGGPSFIDPYGSAGEIRLYLMNFSPFATGAVEAYPTAIQWLTV